MRGKRWWVSTSYSAYRPWWRMDVMVAWTHVRFKTVQGIICFKGDIHSGEGNGNPLQYSCLENPVDRGAWQATVHRVARSCIHLKWLACMHSLGSGLLQAFPVFFACFCERATLVSVFDRWKKPEEESWRQVNFAFSICFAEAMIKVARTQSREWRRQAPSPETTRSLWRSGLRVFLIKHLRLI